MIGATTPVAVLHHVHPDRWTMAGDGVCIMKEEALKRVSAARDELASQVADSPGRDQRET